MSLRSSVVPGGDRNLSFRRARSSGVAPLRSSIAPKDDRHGKELDAAQVGGEVAIPGRHRGRPASCRKSRLRRWPGGCDPWPPRRVTATDMVRPVSCDCSMRLRPSAARRAAASGTVSANRPPWSAGCHEKPSAKRVPMPRRCDPRSSGGRPPESGTRATRRTTFWCDPRWAPKGNRQAHPHGGWVVHRAVAIFGRLAGRPPPGPEPAHPLVDE